MIVDYTAKSFENVQTATVKKQQAILNSYSIQRVCVCVWGEEARYLFSNSSKSYIAHSSYLMNESN